MLAVNRMQQNRLLPCYTWKCIVIHRTSRSFVIFSCIIAGNVMTYPFKFDVTNGFKRLIAIKYDGSLICSDSMGHAGVIKCNVVTNVVSTCLQV